VSNYTSDLTVSTPSLSRSRRLWIAIVLGSLSAFGPLSIDMYLPALPSLSKDLSAGASLTQLSLTACLLGLALGQLIAGSQSDVRGRRIPLLVGLVTFFISSMLCAVSPSIWGLILLRFLQGLAGSVGIVISRAVVRDLYSGSEMTKFFALLMLVNGVGPIMAPILGGQLLQFTTWRGIFSVLSIFGIIMLLAVYFGLPETLPVHRRSKSGLTDTLSTYRSLITDPVFMSYAVPQGFVIAAMFAYISGSPFVIQDIFGASPQLFSIFFAINGLGIIIAGQVTGKLAEKVSVTKLFVFGVSMAAIGGVALLIMILTDAGLYGILAALFVVVSSVGMVGTAGSSLALENYGHAAGSAAALLGLLSFIFGAFVAPLVGIGGNNTAVPMGVVIATVDVGSLLFYVILRRYRQQRNT